MRSEIGLKWVESPNQRQQLKALKELTNSLTDQTVRDTLAGTAGADFLIGGFLAEPYLQAVGEKHNIPVVTAALQPFRPTRSGAASIMPLVARGNSPLNRWMGLLAERVTWTIAEQTTNALRQALGLAPHNARQYAQAGARIQALYAISPQVVPPAPDTNSHTTGYWFLDEAYNPPDTLLHFIEAGEAPLYFGFGSMPSSNPAQTLALISTVLDRIGRRAVVSGGWSNMNTDEHTERVYLMAGAPHNWLFPRMAALVHHGGAGTAAAGLRAGKPALLIPHMGDQGFWARRLYELGVSVQPLRQPELSVDLLTERLRHLLDASSFQHRAAILGQCIREEQGIENATRALSQLGLG
jgi:UDP:flavonoid glycosyltransferase YjiC (YdhE family)